MNKILLEGMDHMDLKGQIVPRISIDEYEAKMGSDDEIVTVSFVVRGNQASEDLVDWFERGYDWVLDAKTSDGELVSGRYVVFVELDRRTMVPDRIIELVEDLETLTGLKVEDWEMKIDGTNYPLDAGRIKSMITLSPHQYRMEKESDLNEMRERAGLEPHKIFKEQDSLLKDFISKAGL